MITVIALGMAMGCKKEDVKVKKDDPPPVIKPDPATVTDIDGNVYKTVRIRHQLWTAENLRTTRFRNGDEIPTTDPVDKPLGITAGQFIYQWVTMYDTSFLADYGRAYTWHAGNDERGLCPIGWHTPTADEYRALIEAIGGDFTAGEGYIGGKLKAKGFTYWNTPNTGATNEYGFNAYGGGLCTESGNWSHFKMAAFFIHYDGVKGPFFLDHYLGRYYINGTAGTNFGAHDRCVMD